ncbi:MAG: hypothetical protein WC852_04715 [Candidatus Nanoarchaeia archaeon]|jgi:hypothetical protein
MTLEDTIVPIELRPHHIERFFVSWVQLGNEYIKAVHNLSNYSDEHTQNILRVYTLIKKNNPLRIVPIFDDLCAKCDFWKRQNKECINPDPQSQYIEDDFELKTGDICTPVEMIVRGIANNMRRKKQYESVPNFRVDAKLCEINKKLAAYSRLYTMITGRAQ